MDEYRSLPEPSAVKWRPPLGLMPPTYLLVAIILTVVLHVMLPVVHLIPWPWNLSGVILIAGGIVLAVVADQQFKRRATTVKPFQASSALVTDGAFRLSRHPMYLGMALAVLGIAVCLGSLSPLAVPPAFAFLLDVLFVGPEERHMAEQFDEAYEQYRSRVRRWL
jgi:protein-S-isoprenylcysteine O-methyltransferase Ste14